MSAETFTKPQTITPDSDATGLTINTFALQTTDAMTVVDSDFPQSIFAVAGFLMKRLTLKVIWRIFIFLVE